MHVSFQRTGARRYAVIVAIPGQHPAPKRSAPVLRDEDAAHVARVVARLNALAPLWRALPVGEALVFEWPSVTPSRR